MTTAQVLLDLVILSAAAGVLGYGLGVRRERSLVRRGGGEWTEGYILGFDEGESRGEARGYERGYRDARRRHRIDRGKGRGT